METPPPPGGQGLRDPDDDALLALALAVRADGLVTGDQDLLVLKEFQSTPILSPRDFYTRLQAQRLR